MERDNFDYNRYGKWCEQMGQAIKENKFENCPLCSTKLVGYISTTTGVSENELMCPRCQFRLGVTDDLWVKILPKLPSYILTDSRTDSRKEEDVEILDETTYEDFQFHRKRTVVTDTRTGRMYSFATGKVIKRGSLIEYRGSGGRVFIPIEHILIDTGDYYR